MSNFAFITSLDSFTDGYLVSEAILKSHSSTLLVSGILSKCYDEWVRICALGFMFSVIRDDYKIPFCGMHIHSGTAWHPLTGESMQTRDQPCGRIGELVSS